MTIQLPEHIVGEDFHLPRCCITVRVTRTAVSVVICIGPSLLPMKPFFRSSDVLSTCILDLVLKVRYAPKDPSSLPRGGSSPRFNGQPESFVSNTA